MALIKSHTSAPAMISGQSSLSGQTSSVYWRVPFPELQHGWMRKAAPLCHRGAALSPVKQIKFIIVNRACWWCSHFPQQALFADPGASSLPERQEMTVVISWQLSHQLSHYGKGLKCKHRGAIKAQILVFIQYYLTSCSTCVANKDGPQTLGIIPRRETC